MKYCVLWLTVLALLLCFSETGFAHRVSVFAYVDGDAIHVECSFSKSQKVRNGILTFTDLVTGTTLLEGTTNEQGVFRFHPAKTFLQTGHGVNILLNAGEGHQNNWQISAEELQALSSFEQNTPVAPSVQQAPPPLTKKRMATDSALTATELEALIGKVVDAKLAPVKQTLAQQHDSGPTVRDIIGGLGWILGLLGLATYMKYKR